MFVGIRRTAKCIGLAVAVVVALMLLLGTTSKEPPWIRHWSMSAKQNRSQVATKPPFNNVNPPKKVTDNKPSPPKKEPNPIPPIETLKAMSHAEIQAFYHKYIVSPQVTCSAVERMGLITDGGWEICNDQRFRPVWENCLVYSFGINFDFSFDDDVAALGCEVHAFDPSMNRKPHRRGQRVSFHDTGIGGQDKITPDKKWQLYTIATHRKILGHTAQKRRLDIVKIDVEGWELESLMTSLQDGSLSDVKQLNFETHVSWSSIDPRHEEYVKFLNLLRHVYDSGFRIYTTHRNYVWSAFASMLRPGKKRVKCHEIHTVNINLINDINDGSTGKH